MIHQIGLLEKTGLAALPDLYRVWAQQNYKRLTESLRDKAPTGSSKNNTLPGIVDTLSEALGQFGLTRRHVKITACAVWDTVSALGMPMPQLTPKPLEFIGKYAPVGAEYAFQALALNERRRLFKPLAWTSRNDNTKVRQCWFLGTHSDVGGGNNNTTLEALSLVWMVAQLETVRDEMFNHDILFTYANPKYLEWKGRFNSLLGKYPAQLKADSGISTG
jgi:uncharacterized protein (DUF2235 family)